MMIDDQQGTPSPFVRVELYSRNDDNSPQDRSISIMAPIPLEDVDGQWGAKLISQNPTRSFPDLIFGASPMQALILGLSTIRLIITCFEKDGIELFTDKNLTQKLNTLEWSVAALYNEEIDSQPPLFIQRRRKEPEFNPQVQH